MEIQGLTDVEETAFEVKRFETNPVTQPTSNRMEIYYMMNKDLTQIDRTVYSTFMLLGDIGGLYGLFVSFASTILGLINY